MMVSNLKYDRNSEFATEQDIDKNNQLKLATKAGNLTAAATLFTNAEQVKALESAYKRTKIQGQNIMQMHQAVMAAGEHVVVKNKVTGKEIPAVLVAKRVRDKDFKKIFTEDVLRALVDARMAGKKLPCVQVARVLEMFGAIIGMAQNDNIIYKSAREISETLQKRGLDASLSTTKRYIKTLQSINMIRSQGHGKYMLNPSLLASAGREDRLALVTIYDKHNQINQLDDEDLPF